MWSDAPEELPDGGYILVREINKALDGEPFKYIPAGERKQKDVPAVEPDAWNYYYSVHRFSKKFGMPHGKGWMHELPWVPEFLCYMDDLTILIEAWMRNRKAPTEGADPGTFAGG